MDRDPAHLHVKPDLTELLPDDVPDRHRQRGAVHVEDGLRVAQVAIRERPRAREVGPLERVDVRVLEPRQNRREVLVTGSADQRAARRDECPAVQRKVHRAPEIGVVPEERSGHVEGEHPHRQPWLEKELRAIEPVLLDEAEGGIEVNA